jgi:hypothetical protein
MEKPFMVVCARWPAGRVGCPALHLLLLLYSGKHSQQCCAGTQVWGAWPWSEECQCGQLV